MPTYLVGVMMTELSNSIHTEPMTRLGHIDHAAIATRSIAEFFAFEEAEDEESKLRNGLRYGVEHGILTQDEADQCFFAYKQTRDQPPAST